MRVLSVLLLGFALGVTLAYQHGQAQLANYQEGMANAQKKQTEEYRRIEQRAQRLTNELAQAQELARNAEQQHAQNIQHEVANYAANQTQQHNNHCLLDGEWVRIHDAAARIMPKNTNAPSRTTQPAPTLADALSTITHNYAQHQACRRQVIGWQAWYQHISETQP